MNLDPARQRKLKKLGLLDLNRCMGWGSNFHDSFKDLNPELNPQYKFIKKKMSRIMAEKMVNNLGHAMHQKLEKQKLNDFK